MKSPRQNKTNLSNTASGRRQTVPSRRSGTESDVLRLQDLDNVGQTSQPAVESEGFEPSRALSTHNKEHDLYNDSGSVGSFPPLPSIQNDYALEIKSFNYYKKPYYQQLQRNQFQDQFNMIMGNDDELIQNSPMQRRTESDEEDDTSLPKKEKL